MKNIIYIVLLLFCVSSTKVSFAQIDILGKIKDKIEEKANEKTDEAIDKSMDDSKKNEENADQEQNNSEETNQSNNQQNENSVKEEPFKAYSKYDFVPGDKTIFYEDFSQDNVGDFPAVWNTNASGEVYTFNSYPGKWFGMGSNGVFLPDLPGKLPENFTMEFDLVYVTAEMNPPDFEVKFISSHDDDAIDAIVPGNGGVALRFGAHNYGIFSWSDGNYSDISNNKDNEYLLNHSKVKTRVSIWFQKQRVRLWINQTKIFDLPRVVPPGILIDKIRFGTWENEETYVFITNMRVAIGAPDMRSKLLTEGKLVTHGILFDVNSDKIKPESYGTLKEIAKVLSENSSVRVKIVGHTDSDGSDAANMELSKKRAESVKTLLSSEFSIDASRMEADGKGESQPVSDNNTALGKAENRRVEFLKL